MVHLVGSAAISLQSGQLEYYGWTELHKKTIRHNLPLQVQSIYAPGAPRSWILTNFLSEKKGVISDTVSCRNALHTICAKLLIFHENLGIRWWIPNTLLWAGTGGECPVPGQVSTSETRIHVHDLWSKFVKGLTLKRLGKVIGQHFASGAVSNHQLTRLDSVCDKEITNIHVTCPPTTGLFTILL